jgi:hypothetical protein
MRRAHHALPKSSFAYYAVVALAAVIGHNYPGATYQAPGLHVTVRPLCYKGVRQPPNLTKSIQANSTLA